MMNTGPTTLPGRLLQREMFLRCHGASGEALTKSCTLRGCPLLTAALQPLKVGGGKSVPPERVGAAGQSEDRGV